MAHLEQLFFVSNLKQYLPSYFSDKTVLEMGSLFVNGTVRDLFSDCRYTGIDLAQGPCVDIACAGQDYGEPASSFDVVISCEMMEHNREWKKTFLNMLRLVKKDGLIIMSCATEGRRQHGTSKYDANASPLTIGLGMEYYRNLTSTDFYETILFDQWFSFHKFLVDHISHDLYLFALGEDASEDHIAHARVVAQLFEQYYLNKNIFGEY